MKRLSLTIAALTFVAMPVFAGGPAVVVTEAEPAQPAAPSAVYDWSGPFFGLSYGTTSGEVVFPGPTGELGEGKLSGAYGGYLVQRGSFVYGGEIAFGKVNDTPVLIGPDDEITSALDLKVRGGFAANRALFYGIVGYSTAQMTVSGSDYDLGGLSVGLGADFAVTDRLTLGLEYLSRDLSGDDNDGLGINADARIDTLSLRLGLAF